MSSESTHWIRFSLAGALVSLLLVFSIRVPDAYGLPKLFAGAVFCAMACGFLWYGSPRRGVGKAPLDPAVLAVLGATLYCALLSPSPLRGLVGQYGYSLYGLFPMLVLAVLYYLGTRSSEDGTIETVLRVYLGAGILCALYAGLQKAGIEPILPHPDNGIVAGRAMSTLGGPVFLGSALVPLCPLGLHFVLRKKNLDRFLGGAALFAAVVGVYASGSRAAFFGGIIGCLFVWIASDKNRARRFLRPVPIALAGAALAAVLAVSMAFGVRSASDSERIDVWKSAARSFAARPILGVGPDSFGEAYRRHRSLESVAFVGSHSGQLDAHNDILQIAATLGVVGLLCYGFLLWRLMLIFRKILGDHDRGPVHGRSIAFMGSVVGVFVFAKVNPVSIAAIAPLCVFMGWLAPREKDAESPWEAQTPSAVFAISCCLVVLSTLFCRADHLRQRAETAKARGDMDTAIISYRRALRLNPAYATYFSSYGTLLSFLVRKAPEEVRRPLAVELFDLARRARRYHPGEVRGAHLVGTACVVGSKLADEDCRVEARRELRRARDLEPFSASVLKTSARAALAENDRAAAADFSTRRRAIVILSQTHGTPKAQSPAALAAKRFLQGS